MTKEEAIRLLIVLRFECDEQEDKEAITLAIDALKFTQPTFTANSDFVGTTLNCIKPYNPSDPNQ